MSQKIKNLLHSGEFVRHKPSFRAAVIETAFRKNLIAYDPKHDLFIDADARQIYIGILDLVIRDEELARKC